MIFESGKNKRNIVFDYLAIIVIYYAAYFFFLVNNGLFWDDWVWTGNIIRGYIEISRKLYALRYPGLLLAFIYLSPPILIRVLISICYLLPGFILYSISQKEGIARIDRIFIVLIFLLIPINLAKYTLAIAAYSFYCLLFYIASYLYINNYNKMGIVVRLVSLILYFLSFTLNSLLAFFAVPFLYVFSKFIRNREAEGVKGIVKGFGLFLKKNFDFAIVPFIFFGIKQIHMLTDKVYKTGIYANIGYNRLHFMDFAMAPVKYFVWLKDALTDSIRRAGYILESNLGVSLLIIAVIVYLVFFTDKTREEKNSKAIVRNIIVSLIIFAFAVFPYIAVGVQYSGGTFGSRNNILLPVSLSFLIYYLFNMIAIKLRISRNMINLFKISLLLSYLLFNISQGKSFYFDNIKQQAIIANITENNDIKTNSVFLVKDNAMRLNANREYNFYDFSGLFYKAFGDEKRIAVYVGPNALNEIKDAYENKNALPYKIKQLNSTIPTYIISINEKKVQTGYGSCITLIYDYVFNRSHYNKIIKNFISISTSKIINDSGVDKYFK